MVRNQVQSCWAIIREQNSRGSSNNEEKQKHGDVRYEEGGRGEAGRFAREAREKGGKKSEKEKKEIKLKRHVPLRIADLIQLNGQIGYLIVISRNKRKWN